MNAPTVMTITILMKTAVRMKVLKKKNSNHLNSKTTLMIRVAQTTAMITMKEDTMIIQWSVR
jgi:hypothetical protein